MFAWLKFLVNKYFWLNIGIIILIGIIFLITVFYSIKIYTHHSKSFPLPDFKGLTEYQFQYLFKKNNLRYSIIDSVYLDNVPKGTVIEQVPKAGEHVKKNRNIFLTINAWSEEQVLIPDLKDYSLRNAKVVLESYGLKPGDLIYIPSEYTNLVLGQQLYGKLVEQGTIVPKGTSIDLLIGRGLGKELTSVPNLLGLEKSVAEQIVQRVFLFIGGIILDESIVTSEDSARAFIWKQNPVSRSGAMLNVGASIDIWLTTNELLLIPDETSVTDDDIDYDSDLEREFF